MTTQFRWTHQSLIDRVRWRATEYLWFFGLPVHSVFVTPGDNGMITVNGNHGARPDVYFFSERLADRQIVVECGSIPFNRESKWLETCASIHVDYFGGVALLNKRDETMERLIFRAVQAAFDPWEPENRPSFWWNHCDSKARFAEEIDIATWFIADGLKGL